MSGFEANRKSEERTLFFAGAIIQFAATLPKTETGRIIERQLVKAGTAVGANYREANRAESRDDFVHKTALVLKESAETVYGLDLCERMEFGDGHQRAWLCRESRELLAIFTIINRGAKHGQRRD